MHPISSNSGSPRRGILSVQQGRESAQAGQWVSALAAYDQAQHADAAWEGDPDFLNDRAVALFHNERWDEGVRLLDAAIQLQPNYGYRYAARGWMKQARKDIHGAIADYQKALELDPEDAITLNNLGLLEEQMGRMQSAKRRFAAADEVDRLLEERDIPKASETTLPPHQQPAGSFSRPAPRIAGTFHEIKRALFTTEGRKEFLDFLRNGFILNG